ncbi:MAG: DUF4230 domain-containing protein [Verrucomicrobiota bacterium]
MWKRAFLLFFGIAFIFGFGLVFGILTQKFLRRPPPPPQIQNTTALLKQVQTISELTTVKYIFEKLVILEVPPESTLSQFFAGQNRLMLIAHGVVKAGIDLQKMGTNDLHVSEKKISIKLPPAQITDAYLDDKKTQVLERKTGFMRSFDRDLEQNARRQAVDDLRRAARSNGILKEADERAKLQLKGLFQNLGFGEVEFLN